MNSTGEMIFTGDELLRGDAINTNQAYLGEKLLDLGILATHALCVADDRQAIVTAIRESLARRPVVLTLSGGLGPTDDDLTREAAAEALDRPLEHHESLLEEIRERFASRGFEMGESNRKQASLPRGASAIPISGTAPGFIVQHGDTLVVALPGVPWELKEMWESTVEPLLRARAGGRIGHAVRRIRTFGIGESMAAEMLSEFEWRGSEVEIGTRAQLDGLTIILRGTASPEGIEMLDATQARICAILGDRVFGVDSEGLPEITGGLLRQAGLTVAVAESCTGGLVAKRFTDVPGSSDYFVGGVTAYDNDVKTRILGVPARLLAEHGAVSNEVAAAMAEGVRGLLRTDCSLSTTGVAGPGGGSDEKPVGLLFIGSVVQGITQVERLRLFGRRDQFRERAALAAIDLLRRRLQPGASQ
jgi:nicotinamide-nucleotide amidase